MVILNLKWYDVSFEMILPKLHLKNEKQSTLKCIFACKDKLNWIPIR